MYLTQHKDDTMKKAFLLCIVGLVLLTSTSLYSQNDCEGLNIVQVYMDPLNLNRLIIEVENNGEETFGYPGFKVFKDGEELGSEEVNFFGIGAESTHFISMENIFEDGEEVDLTFELWTTFYADLACVFEWSGKPYDSSECFELTFNLQWAGGSGNFLNIVMYDQVTEEELFSTEGFFDVVNPSFTETFCAQQGCYIYKVTADETLQNDYFINFYNGGFFSLYTGVAMEGDQGITDLIEVWDGCIPQNISESKMLEGFAIAPNPASNQVSFNLSAGAERIEILDLNGRIIESVLTSTLEVSSYEDGCYFVRVTFENGEVQTKRLLIQ